MSSVIRHSSRIIADRRGRRSARKLHLTAGHRNRIPIRSSRLNAAAEAAGINNTHLCWRRLCDIDLDTACAWAMRQTIAEVLPEHSRSRCYSNGFALSQPVWHHAQRKVKLRVAIFIGLEEKNVANQRHELCASPAVGNVAHVPEAIRHLAKILGDRIAMLFVPRAEHDLPGRR